MNQTKPRDVCIAVYKSYAWDVSCGSDFEGWGAFECVLRKSLGILWMQLKKQNEVTSKRNKLMIYQFQNSGRRIQRSVSHPTTPEEWNIIIVVGKLMSAMVVTAWQNRAMKNSKIVGVECWKGLVFKSWYLIPIEANSKVIRIV